MYRAQPPSGNLVRADAALADILGFDRPDHGLTFDWTQATSGLGVIGTAVVRTGDQTTPIAARVSAADTVFSLPAPGTFYWSDPASFRTRDELIRVCQDRGIAPLVSANALAMA